MDVTAVSAQAATSCDRRVLRKRIQSSASSKWELEKKKNHKILDKIKMVFFNLILLDDFTQQKNSILYFVQLCIKAINCLNEIFSQK